MRTKEEEIEISEMYEKRAEKRERVVTRERRERARRGKMGIQERWRERLGQKCGSKESKRRGRERVREGVFGKN